MKSFKYWKRQEIEEVFGVEEVETHALLEDWLISDCDISEKEKADVEELRLLLRANVDYWNEAELKIKFLGPFLHLVNYDTKEYRAFMERPFTARKGEEEASGTVDFVIAKGRQIPRSPFFCVHEYKPDPSASNDPLGQLLIGLLAVYQENMKKGIDFPLYGVYVVGRLFYFVVFDGKTYAKSDAFVATQSDIIDIFCYLKKVKTYIEKNL